MRKNLLSFLLFWLMGALQAFAQFTPSTEGNEHWYTLAATPRTQKVASDVEGTLKSLDRTNAFNQMWKFVQRSDGSYDIINRATSRYMNPVGAPFNALLPLSTTQPTAGWTFANGATQGTYIIKSGSVQLNQTDSSRDWVIFNWGGGNNTNDAGCQFTISEYTGRMMANAVPGYNVTGRGSEQVLFVLPLVAPAEGETKLTSVSLNLSNAAAYEKVKLYFAPNNEFYSLQQPTLVAEADAAATLTVQVPAEAGVMGNSLTYLFVTATVSNQAIVGSTVDATLTEVAYTNGGNPATVELQGTLTASAKVFTLQKMLWASNMDGSKYYRIPGLVEAADGSIVAVADKRYNGEGDLGNHKIDVVMRRSTDGGRTWTESTVIAAGDGQTEKMFGVGDPALVRTNSGKLICLMAGGSHQFQAGGLLYIYKVESTDNGVTWSEPVEITAPEYFTDKVSGTQGVGSAWRSFFVTSGRGICTKDGRVMFLMVCSPNGGGNYSSRLLYSDDEGQHWTLDDALVYQGADEAKLAQRADGSILASIRRSGERGFNVGSSDGHTWMNQYNASTLVGNSCNADLLYYNEEMLLHSILVNTGRRADLRIFASFDGGATWEQKTTITGADAGYSVMERLHDGSIALLYEDRSYAANGYGLNFVVIPANEVESWAELPQNETSTVKVARSTEADVQSLGTRSTDKKTWTTTAASGMAGLQLSLAQANTSNTNGFDWGRYWGQANRAMVVFPSTNNGTDRVNITAPNGYVITGYRVVAACFGAAETYTLTDCKGGTAAVTSTANPGTTPMLNVTGLNTQSTYFTFSMANSTNGKYIIFPVIEVDLKLLDMPVKVADETATGADTYGTFADDAHTWTSGEAASRAGLKLLANQATLGHEMSEEVNSLTMNIPSEETEEGYKLTIDAPFGYVITDIDMLPAAAEGESFSVSFIQSEAPQIALITASNKTNAQPITISGLRDRSYTLTFNRYANSAGVAGTQPLRFYRFLVYLKPRAEQASYADAVQRDITPWFTQNVGKYFGMKEDVVEANRETYERALQMATQQDYFDLRKVVNEGKSMPATGYYLLKNMRPNTQKYLTINGSTLTGAESVQRNPSTVVMLEKNEDGSYYIKLQGQYIQGYPAIYQPYQLGTNPVKFYPSVIIPGEVAYSPGSDIQSLHLDGSNRLVGWYNDQGATRWMVEPAQEVELTFQKANDGAAYTAATLPFPVQLPENVKAYSVNHLTQDKAMLVDQMDVVPAEMPVVLELTGDITEATTATARLPIAAVGAGTAPEENLLIGTLLPTEATGSALLSLGKDEATGKAAFLPWQGTQLPANSAFLQGDATHFLSVIPTGLTTVKVEEQNDAPTFNLAGQRVDKHYKGLVVTKGRKHLQR